MMTRKRKVAVERQYWLDRFCVDHPVRSDRADVLVWILNENECIVLAQGHIEVIPLRETLFSCFYASTNLPSVLIDLVIGYIPTTLAGIPHETMHVGYSQPVLHIGEVGRSETPLWDAVLDTYGLHHPLAKEFFFGCLGSLLDPDANTLDYLFPVFVCTGELSSVDFLPFDLFRSFFDDAVVWHVDGVPTTMASTHGTQQCFALSKFPAHLEAAAAASRKQQWWYATDLSLLGASQFLCMLGRERIVIPVPFQDACDVKWSTHGVGILRKAADHLSIRRKCFGFEFQQPRQANAASRETLRAEICAVLHRSAATFAAWKAEIGAAKNHYYMGRADRWFRDKFQSVPSVIIPPTHAQHTHVSN